MLRARFMEVFDTKEQVQVEVILNRLVARGDKRRKSAGSGALHSGTGFHGPEYPID
jgi:hypothetical protein